MSGFERLENRHLLTCSIITGEDPVLPISDVNGDGIDDVFVNSGFGEIRTFQDGQLIPLQGFDVGPDNYLEPTGDLNGDGLQNFIVRSNVGDPPMLYGPELPSVDPERLADILAGVGSYEHLRRDPTDIWDIDNDGAADSPCETTVDGQPLFGVNLGDVRRFRFPSTPRTLSLSDSGEIQLSGLDDVIQLGVWGGEMSFDIAASDLGEVELFSSVIFDTEVYITTLGEQTGSNTGITYAGDPEDLTVQVLVDLRVVDAVFREGDVDLDGETDFADFLQLAENFGSEGGRRDGDLDGDGIVAFADFLILADSFGAE